MPSLTVIPAKRSASRNPGRFAGYDTSSKNRLESRPGFPRLLSAGMTSAGVTFFRGNDGIPARFAEYVTTVTDSETQPFSRLNVATARGG